MDIFQKFSLLIPPRQNKVVSSSVLSFQFLFYKINLNIYYKRYYIILLSMEVRSSLHRARQLHVKAEMAMLFNETFSLHFLEIS